MFFPAIIPYEESRFRIDLASLDAGGGALSSGATTPRGQAWNNTGSRFFVIEGDSGSTARAYYYTISSTGTPSLSGSITLDTGTNRDYQSLAFNGDGSRIYAQYAAIIETYTLSSNFGGTSTFVSSESGIGFGTIGGIQFSNDGAKLYYNQSGTLRVRTLSTPYDISTRGAPTDLEVPWGTIARNGTRLVSVNTSEELLTEFEGDPYDFGNFTAKATLSLGGLPVAIYKPDGTNLVVRQSGGNITQYSTVL